MPVVRTFRSLSLHCALIAASLLSWQCAPARVPAPLPKSPALSIQREAKRSHIALAALTGGRCQGALALEWTFRAASPFSGAPALSAAGDLVLLRTYEGYVHALSTSGKFLWSYTTEGSLDVPPVVTVDGSNWLDSTGNLYRISARGGTMRHEAQPLRRVEGMAPAWPLAVAQRGRHLFGLTKELKQSWTEVYPSPFVSEMVPFQGRYAQGVLANGTLVTVQSPGRQWQLSLTNAKSVQRASVVSSGNGSLAVLQLEPEPLSSDEDQVPLYEAVFVSAQKVKWRVASGKAAALGESSVVMIEDDQVRWLDRNDGTQQTRVEVEGLSDTPPLLLPDESAIVAILADKAVVIHRDHGLIGSCRLEPGRAYAPLLFDDGLTSRVVVATGGGHAVAFLVSLDLEGAPAASPERSTP